MNPRDGQRIVEDQRSRRYVEHVRFCVVQLQCALSCIRLAEVTDISHHVARAETILERVRSVRSRRKLLPADAERVDALEGMVRARLSGMPDHLSAIRSCLACSWRMPVHVGAARAVCLQFRDEGATQGPPTYIPVEVARATPGLCAGGAQWEADASR